MTLAQPGRFSIVTNIPLINIKGNLTRLDIIIIFAGLSVGKEENMEPREANAKEAKTIVKSKMRIFAIVPPNNNVPARIIITEIAKLKIIPASISPKIIVLIEPGVVSSLSNVLVLVSQGVIKGPTEEPAKKNDIASNPGISCLMAIPLPKAKAKNRKNGNKMP